MPMWDNRWIAPWLSADPVAIDAPNQSMTMHLLSFDDSGMVTDAQALLGMMSKAARVADLCTGGRSCLVGAIGPIAVEKLWTWTRDTLRPDPSQGLRSAGCNLAIAIVAFFWALFLHNRIALSLKAFATVSIVSLAITAIVVSVTLLRDLQRDLAVLRIHPPSKSGVRRPSSLNAIWRLIFVFMPIMFITVLFCGLAAAVNGPIDDRHGRVITGNHLVLMFAIAIAGLSVVCTLFTSKGT